MSKNEKCTRKTGQKYSFSCIVKYANLWGFCCRRRRRRRIFLSSLITNRVTMYKN